MKALVRKILGWTLALAATVPAVSHAIKLTQIDDGRVIYVTLIGIIFPTTPANIKPILDRAVQKKPVALFIQSPGGAFIAIRPMANLILDLAKRQYQIYNKPLMVNFQFVCGSACSVLSSILTKERDPKTLQIRVSNDTEFGFHGSVIRENGKTDMRATLVSRDRLEHEIYQAYLDAGVSPDFLANNKDMFKTHFKQKLFTAEELCEQRTMVIPPDSCVANQMMVYRWIMELTGTPEELKQFVPDGSDSVAPPENLKEDKNKSDLDGPHSYGWFQMRPVARRMLAVRTPATVVERETQTSVQIFSERD